MRPVTINVNDFESALREIQTASHENDIVEIAQNFTFDAAFTPTLQLQTSTSDLDNVVLVLATLLQIMQKGGLNRTT